MDTTLDPTALSATHVPTDSAAPSLSEGRARATGVAGGPRLVLRLEGAAALVAACLAYRALGGGWGWFALLFLAPDLSMLGYLAGPRVGAAAYNTAHSYLAAAAVAALAAVLHQPLALLGACILAAHVGFDRLLGYGLKYGTHFHDTHLGRVGRRA